MALVIVNSGRLAHANALRSWFNANTVLKLFINNYAPQRGDTAANYTEASFGGYTAVALSQWGAAALTADFHALLTEIARTFIVTGPPFTQTVYGYFVVDGAGNLQWAEQAPTPLAMNALNLAFSVVPQYTYTSETGA